jgi:hypothetical protein
MEKVYLVHYDNGQNWEDHHVYVEKIFSSKESANKYAEEKNATMQNYTPSVTEEMYISKNWAESNGMSYTEFIENEQYDWSMNRDAKYYVSESEVYS